MARHTPRRPPITKATVLIDTREKFPQLFPHVLTWFIDGDITRPFQIPITVKRKKLSEGDLGLEGHLDRCLIERKASLSEIWGNHCTNDRQRFLSAFDRFIRATAHPYLWITTSTHDLLNPNNQVKIPQHVHQRLCTTISASRCRLLLWPPAINPRLKRLQGTYLLTMMLTHAMYPDLPVTSGPELICDSLVTDTDGGPHNLSKSTLKIPNKPFDTIRPL